MGWIDLTHPLTNGMPVIPGDASPEVLDVQTLDRDGCSVQEIRCTNHVGTHVDAPLHFLSGGMSVERIPLHKLLGYTAVLDFSGLEAGARIQWRELEHALAGAGNPDKVLIHTGWDRDFGSPQYFRDFPALSREAAEGLAGLQIDLLGVDTPSPSQLDDPEQKIHKDLLAAEIVIVENLCGLKRLVPFAEVVILPLAIREASGAPCRAVGRPQEDSS
ncbi:MAG: cyclase family protein [Desulfohalobiaceae bacterium]|nr:cyclase family protein [Desulfohalobiaceae bacterium]